MNKINKVTIILRSCLTGRAVWIYQGDSKRVSAHAYWYACKREIERFRLWSKTVVRRKANIQRLLSECMAGMDVTAVMTPEQKAAAKRLAALSEEPAVYDREFYDHIMEERRRRERDRKIRQKMRSRDSSGNSDYDKREEGA